MFMPLYLHLTVLCSLQVPYPHSPQRRPLGATVPSLEVRSRRVPNLTQRSGLRAGSGVSSNMNRCTTAEGWAQSLCTRVSVYSAWRVKPNTTCHRVFPVWAWSLTPYFPPSWATLSIHTSCGGWGTVHKLDLSSVSMKFPDHSSKCLSLSSRHLLHQSASSFERAGLLVNLQKAHCWPAFLGFVNSLGVFTITFSD